MIFEEAWTGGPGIQDSHNLSPASSFRRARFPFDSAFPILATTSHLTGLLYTSYSGFFGIPITHVASWLQEWTTRVFNDLR